MNETITLHKSVVTSVRVGFREHEADMKTPQPITLSIPKSQWLAMGSPERIDIEIRPA